MKGPSAGWQRRFLHGDVAAILLVILVSVLTYARTATYSLVWDDPLLVAQADAAYRRGGGAGLLAAEFLDTGETTAPAYYRPVTLASIWLDTRIAAALPWNYHRTNIMLHAANVLLLFLLLRALFASKLAALFGALLFAVHPVNSEAVAFVSGRTDLWAAIFVQASILLWLKGRRSAAAEGWIVRGASTLALILGGLAKEVALLLPFVLAGWEVILTGDRNPASPGRRKRLATWSVLWLAAWLVVGLLRWRVSADWSGRQSLPWPVISFQVLATSLVKVSHYLKLLLLPWPLNAYYTADQVVFGWTALAAALLFCGGCVALSGRRDRRTGVLAAIWVLAFLLPVLGFLPISGAAIAERFLYLPSIGLSLIVAGLVEKVLVRAPAARLVSALATGILFVLAGATIARAAVWRNPVSLFEDLTRTSPRFAKAHLNLGTAYARLGLLAAAVAEFEGALQIDPISSSAYYNMGLARAALGQREAAREAYRQAVRLKPDFAEAFNNLGTLDWEDRRYSEALSNYEAALKLSPGYAPAHFNRGLVYRALNQLRPAREAFEQAVRLNPDYVTARFALGQLYAAVGEKGLAVEQQLVLQRLNPREAQRLLGSIAAEESRKANGAGSR